MFQTIIKKYQSTHGATTWQQTIKNREIAKNNFRATGDIRKAKAFVNSIAVYKPRADFAKHDEQIVFSYNSLALATEPAYIFVN